MIAFTVRNKSRPDQMAMIIKNFRPVKLDKRGWELKLDDEGNWKRTKSWYAPGMPVYEFDLYFAKSRRYYGTEYVRARDNRQAKRKIKHLYPWVERYDFGESYAD